MKTARIIILGIAFSSLLAGSGCKLGTVVDEEQLAADGTEAMTASSQSTHLGNIVFQSVSVADPQMAAQQLAGQTALWPAGCVTRAKDPANPLVVHVTFSDCTGPFGLVHLNGEELVTLSPGEGGALHVVMSSVNLTANGKPINHSATADVTFAGDMRNVAWQGSWDRTNDKGVTVQHTSDLTIAVDTAAGCSTANGTAQTSVGARGVDTTITGYKLCRDATTGEVGCPTGTVTHTGKVSGKTVTISFDGSDMAEVTGPAGATFEVPLVCSASASGT
jgi:hypothetical protein